MWIFFVRRNKRRIGSNTTQGNHVNEAFDENFKHGGGVMGIQIKFVEWKIENYKLKDSDLTIIESILLYETEDS